MSQFASFEPTQPVLSEPTCPQCSARMWLARIEPDKAATISVPSSVRAVRRWSAKSSSSVDVSPNNELAMNITVTFVV